MKTSSKLLILAALILLGTITVYDFALEAEYKKSTYKIPPHRVSSDFFKMLNNKNFDTIEILPANLLRVEIIRSDSYDVKINRTGNVDNIKIIQKGRKLIISYETNKGNFQGFEHEIYISCPSLKYLSTNAIVLLNGKSTIYSGETTPTNRNDYTRGYLMYGVKVKGFRQDSLTVTVNNASGVAMIENTIGYLKTELGNNLTSSRSTLNIENSNRISSANFNLMSGSKLEIMDVNINKVKTHISNTAEVHLTGAALNLLK